MKAYTENAGLRFPQFDVTTVVGFKRGRKVLKSMDMDVPVMDCDAYVANIPGDNRAVVVIDKKVAMMCGNEFYCIVAHEAVHCMQAWCESIEEDSPAPEEQAYMVQTCMSAILNGVEEERKRKG